MKDVKKINLNLASNPVLNKRLFHLCVYLICALVILFLFLDIKVYFRFKTENQSLKKEILDKEQNLKQVQKEEEKYSAQIQKITVKNRADVEFFNRMIYKKIFSWTDLFTELEKALPESCYIVSLSPIEVNSSDTEIRLRVSHPGLTHLLSFVENLKKAGFSRIKMVNEAGQVGDTEISEISICYERTF